MDRVFRVAGSPISIGLCAVLGLLVGVFVPEHALKLEVVGAVYLSFLKLAVMPFLLATILVGIVGLLRREAAAKLMRRIVTGFIASSLICTAIGLTVVSVNRGEISPERKIALGSLVTVKSAGGGDFEMTMERLDKKPEAHDPMRVVSKFLPDNIFSALTSGESLKVVIFCLVFGISLGRLRDEGLSVILRALGAIQGSCIAIFKFLNIFLPVALVAMIGSQVAKVGLAIFGVLLDVIAQQIVGALSIVVLGALFIAWKSKQSIFRIVNETKDALILSLSSRSSLACIPYAQDALVRLGFEKSSVDLLIPLSFTINRIGPATYFAISTCFIAKMYDVPLGVSGYAVVLFGSILAGLASAGSTGVLTVATTAVVCELIGLPHEAMIILLIAVDPVMDMVRTASQVYGNMAVCSYVSDCSTETTTCESPPMVI